jgi:hypothetical protein
MENCTPRSLSLDTTVVAVQSQVSTELNGEIVILELHAGTYYGLNRTGGFIWHRLQQPVLVRTLCHALLETYDVDQEQCVRSVVELLHELLAHLLIEIRDDSIA